MSEENPQSAAEVLEDTVAPLEFHAPSGLLSINLYDGAAIEDLQRAFQKAALHIQRTGLREIGSGEQIETPINALCLTPNFYIIAGFNLNAQHEDVKERMNQLQRNPLSETASPGTYLPLIFQSGNPAAVGYNGVTFESVTQVLIDRLTNLNVGDNECFLNTQALNHFRIALSRLNERRARLMGEQAKEVDQVLADTAGVETAEDASPQS